MTHQTAFELSDRLDRAMKPLSPEEAHSQLCIANNCVDHRVVVFGNPTESWGEDEIAGAREDQEIVYGEGDGTFGYEEFDSVSHQEDFDAAYADWEL